MSKFEMIAGRKIYLDTIYSLCYNGGVRELTADKQKEYNKLIRLPPPLQDKIRSKMKLWENPENDPNVIPVTGRQLMEFIRDLKFTPIFDQYFGTTRRIFLTDIQGYEYIKSKTKESLLKAR